MKFSFLKKIKKKSKLNVKKFLKIVLDCVKFKLKKQKCSLK